MNTRRCPYLDTYENPTGLGMNLHTIGKLRRDDVLAALCDTTTCTNGTYKFGPLPWSPVSLDGEAHARKRRTYSHFFTPKAIDQYRALIEPIAARVVDDIARRPRAELVSFHHTSWTARSSVPSGSPSSSTSATAGAEGPAQPCVSLGCSCDGAE